MTFFPGPIGRHSARLSGDFGFNQLELNLGRGHDDLSVRKLDNGRYRFDVIDQSTGQRQIFDLRPDQVARLTVKMGKGRDKAVINSNVDIPFRLEGNRGRDEIHNAADGMELRGGRGGDYINNAGLGTHIVGGRGRDQIDDHGYGGTVNLRGGGRDSYNSAYNGSVVRMDRGDFMNGLPAWQRSAMSPWSNLGRIDPFGGGAEYSQGWSDGYSAGRMIANPWPSPAQFGIAALSMGIASLFG